jgi:predicted nucleic acid-binding protein
VSDIYFDTNIIIDALARRPQALAELRRAKRQWISRMTWIEVLAGMPVLARAETEAYLQNYSIRELSPEITRNVKDFPANMPGIRVPYITPDKV